MHDMHGRKGQDFELEFQEKLLRILTKEQVLVAEPMSRHTTFRVGGPADYYLKPNAAQIKEVLALCEKESVPVQIIGNGSNLLVGDGGVRGVVLEIGSGMDGLTIEGNVITAQAGASLARIAQEAAKASLSGLEFASGIPGTVGGAVVMNAGAYGGEIRDVLKWADVLLPEGEIHRFTTEELHLSYRHSIVPELSGVVLAAAFALEQGERIQIREHMEELRVRRVAKQPLEYPSAGSTFKRPEGHFAGKLIMDAGLKGYRVGGAQVSEKHCGFVINREHATAADILKLMQEVQDKVQICFGVQLEPEVKLIGEF